MLLAAHEAILNIDSTYGKRTTKKNHFPKIQIVYTKEKNSKWLLYKRKSL